MGLTLHMRQWRAGEGRVILLGCIHHYSRCIAPSSLGHCPERAHYVAVRVILQLDDDAVVNEGQTIVLLTPEDIAGMQVAMHEVLFEDHAQHSL